MQYRKLGNIKTNVSALGHGCMRLPTEGQSGKIKHEEAIQLIRKGIDNGINYIDTAWTYHRGESEVVVGKALKDGYRERVTLVTKCPVGSKDFTEPEHFDKYLDEQLQRLDDDSVDIYLFHALNKKLFEEKVLGLNLIERAMQAKKEGKIKHLGFSFHDKPEVLKEIIDSGYFELMLVQYNIVDQVNHDMINYAGEKGLAVAIMGSVGGGRLGGSDLPDEMKEWITPGRKNFADLALKFVLSNPNVSVALSGMGFDEELDDNLCITSQENHNQITEKEQSSIDGIAKRFKELCDLVCTGCKYCEPCPNEVNISFIFNTLQRYQIYGVRGQAKYLYSVIGNVPWAQGKDASACEECGECLEKCPQSIEIIEQLKNAHETLCN
ncbi:MAG: aldo/keto reductase [Candidatus Thorarchaeota archaeon]|nr:aldo/keto reductase [Candidatus Thorarchaeota archaeon]